MRDAYDIMGGWRARAAAATRRAGEVGEGGRGAVRRAAAPDEGRGTEGGRVDTIPEARHDASWAQVRGVQRVHHVCDGPAQLRSACQRPQRVLGHASRPPCAELCLRASGSVNCQCSMVRTAQVSDGG